SGSLSGAGHDGAQKTSGPVAEAAGPEVEAPEGGSPSSGRSVARRRRVVAGGAAAAAAGAAAAATGAAVVAEDVRLRLDALQAGDHPAAERVGGEEDRLRAALGGRT